MKTRKQIMKEFLDAKAKSVVVTADPQVDAKKEAENARVELNAKFFQAVANKDTQALRAMQADIKEEYKALGDGQNVTTDADGGFLVPIDVSNQIIDRLKYLSPIRQYATVLNLGAKTKINIADGKPTAYWVDEGEIITRSKATFSQKELTLEKVAGLGGMSYEALNDTVSTPDLQTYVVNAFAEAISDKEIEAFVNGDGTKKPWGFRSSDITPVAKTSATLDFKALVSLKYGLKKSYRDRGVFVAGSGAIESLVGLEDSQGRPIFVSGLQENESDVLLGRPVVEVNEIPANEVWYVYLPDYIIGEGGALRVDFGTTGDDFETDKISVRVIHRVAGRPTLSDGFAKLTLSDVSV